MTGARVVVVTGANRGLGREVARQCAERGDTVLLGSRNLGSGERAARELQPGVRGRVRAVPLDVTDAGGLTALAQAVSEAEGRVDVLVNNARVHYHTWQTAATADLAAVREAIETNVMGAWQTTLAFLPLLRRSAHPRRGGDTGRTSENLRAARNCVRPPSSTTAGPTGSGSTGSG